MEQISTLNVAIVGSGSGCKAIMGMIFSERLSQLRMKLLGVAYTSTDTVGYRYAQENGIFTTMDHRDLYKLKDLNMIIEVTGREEVANEISRTKPGYVRLMDHVAARLFWDVSKIDEERIAEREQAAAALRESEQKYSSLVENSVTGIYIDLDGKLAFVNNRFAEIYGYSRDELIGSESWRLVHPEDRAMTDEIRMKRLKGEEAPSQYEARGLTKEGKTIWITRRNSRTEYEGSPAILGNVVEITARKRAEEALKKARDELEKRVEERTFELSKANKLLKKEISDRERAEEGLRKINEELKHFAHVTSHDLKTPLVYILGFSSILLENYYDVLDEKGRTCLERIDASAHRMEVLVSDILALSTLGRVVSTLEHIPSHDIVGDVISDLRERLQGSRIELVVKDNFPTIYCDRDRTYQVFQNLLVNAIKFLGDTKDPMIEIGYEDSGGFDQFYVKDNGIGIDPKYHREIFEKFHRLKEVHDDEGTGLGLAIVERIVTNHGGRVWVESEKGKGAAFYFTLPKTSQS